MDATDSWPAPGTWWSDDKTKRKQAELEIMIVPAIARLVDRASAQKSDLSIETRGPHQNLEPAKRCGDS